jgi:hypothetical protein
MLCDNPVGNAGLWLAQNSLHRPRILITDGSQYYPSSHEISHCCRSQIFIRTCHVCKNTPLERAASSLPFHGPFFQIPDLVSSFHQLSGFQNRLFPWVLRRKVVPLLFSPVNTGSNRSLPAALTLKNQNDTEDGGKTFLRNVGINPLHRKLSSEKWPPRESEHLCRILAVTVLKTFAGDTNWSSVIPHFTYYFVCFGVWHCTQFSVFASVFAIRKGETHKEKCPA